MRNTLLALLALLAVITVMAAHAAYRLVRLPFPSCVPYPDTRPLGPS